MNAPSASPNPAVPRLQLKPVDVEQYRGARDENGHDPTAPRATLVPVSRDRVAPHTPARSARPPSNGNPGSRLKTATTRLLHISRASRTESTVASVVTEYPAHAPPARASDTSGPARR